METLIILNALNFNCEMWKRFKMDKQIYNIIKMYNFMELKILFVKYQKNCIILKQINSKYYQ